MNKFVKWTSVFSVVFLSNVTVIQSSVANDAVSVVAEKASCPAFLQQHVRKLHSKEVIDLCTLTSGKTVLVVNTASNCGFTPQFKGLEALYKQYKDQGLVVVGFPSDDFFQEEDDEQDTAKVCFVNYGVTFTMLETSSVRGSDANPVFQHIGEQTAFPKWNFYKYLITDNGKNITLFNSRVEPDDQELIKAIETSIAQTPVQSPVSTL